MRERGLKQSYGVKIEMVEDVAPHAGAWIETGAWVMRRWSPKVAPHAGAWIETALD